MPAAPQNRRFPTRTRDTNTTNTTNTTNNDRRAT